MTELIVQLTTRGARPGYIWDDSRDWLTNADENRRRRFSSLFCRAKILVSADVDLFGRSVIRDAPCLACFPIRRS